MTQVAVRPRGKKTVRVVTTVTGLAAGAAFLPAAHAEAATNYQIAMWTPYSISRVQICGYNQHSNWVCTGDDISRSVATGLNGYDYYKNNWWWHGHVELWWNQHASRSWDQCWLTSNFIGSISRSWVGLVAQKGQTKC
jgi:hypothetical protein